MWLMLMWLFAGYCRLIHVAIEALVIKNEREN
jgi:hypothetical protein